MLTVKMVRGEITGFIMSLKVNRNLADKTLRAYGYDLNGFALWVAENVKGKVGRDELAGYFHSLVDGELKPASIRRKMASVGAFIDYCIEHGRLSREDKPSRMKGGFIIPRRLPKTISDHNILAILETAHEQVKIAAGGMRKMLAFRNRALLELLYCTGARIGELSEANLVDLDLANRELLIHGKGRKERLVFISNDEVLAVVEAWLGVRGELRPAGDALFVNRYGGRLSIYGIEDVFAGILKAAGVKEHATPHYLRHSFATKLLANGANVRDVQDLLGHSSIMTTQIYTEVSAERKRYVLSHYNGRNSLLLHAKCS